MGPLASGVQTFTLTAALVVLLTACTAITTSDDDTDGAGALVVVETHVADARTAVEAEAWQEAVAAYDRALATWHDEAEYPFARQDIQEERDRTAARVLAQSAAAALEEGDHESALALVHEALELATGDAFVTTVAARVTACTADTAAVRHVCDARTALEAQAWQQAAEGYAQALAAWDGRVEYPFSIEEIEQERDHATARVLAQSAAAALEEGNPEAALALIEEALQLAPEEGYSLALSVQLLANRARAAVASGMYESAVVWYSDLLAVERSHRGAPWFPFSSNEIAAMRHERNHAEATGLALRAEEAFREGAYAAGVQWLREAHRVVVRDDDVRTLIQSLSEEYVTAIPLTEGDRFWVEERDGNPMHHNLLPGSPLLHTTDGEPLSIPEAHVDLSWQCGLIDYPLLLAIHASCGTDASPADFHLFDLEKPALVLSRDDLVAPLERDWHAVGGEHLRYLDAPTVRGAYLSPAYTPDRNHLIIRLSYGPAEGIPNDKVFGVMEMTTGEISFVGSYWGEEGDPALAALSPDGEYLAYAGMVAREVMFPRM